MGLGMGLLRMWPGHEQATTALARVCGGGDQLICRTIRACCLVTLTL